MVNLPFVVMDAESKRLLLSDGVLDTDDVDWFKVVELLSMISRYRETMSTDMK